jgi:hypothetical protein
VLRSGHTFPRCLAKDRVCHEGEGSRAYTVDLEVWIGKTRQRKRRYYVPHFTRYSASTSALGLLLEWAGVECMSAWLGVNGRRAGGGGANDGKNGEDEFGAEAKA